MRSLSRNSVQSTAHSQPTMNHNHTTRPTALRCQSKTRRGKFYRRRRAFIPTYAIPTYSHHSVRINIVVYGLRLSRPPSSPSAPTSPPSFFLARLRHPLPRLPSLLICRIARSPFTTHQASPSKVADLFLPVYFLSPPIPSYLSHHPPPFVGGLTRPLPPLTTFFLSPSSGRDETAMFLRCTTTALRTSPFFHETSRRHVPPPSNIHLTSVTRSLS
ncbi:hypothetical protein CSAL01_05168 [Colletotrichum salicis]|uniref:Uncharacterized protein n=1 Tax=Colletotrichum salicis TaxID=1209931 RepID=A0A135V7U4_9PEZI|nr:hypothetical protein CSAL01_05168 [Colletotrichum salicis]